MKYFLLSLMLLSNLNHALAGHEGGGGDSDDIKKEMGRRSPFDKEFLKFDEIAEDPNRKVAFQEFSIWSSQVVTLYTALRLLEYPLGLTAELEAKITPEFLEKTLDQFQDDGDWSPNDSFKVKNNLKEKGSEVLFYSDAKNQRILMNFNRWIKMLKAGALDFTVDCKSKEPCEGSAGWYNESYDFEVAPKQASAILATIFHEAMVLNGIEQSRTYTYSKKFAEAVETLMTKKSFFTWAANRPHIKNCELTSTELSDLASVTSSLDKYDHDGERGFHSMIFEEGKSSIQFWYTNLAFKGLADDLVIQVEKCKSAKQ